MNNHTAKTLSALTADELGLLAAPLVNPGPWEHNKKNSEDYGFTSCSKCGELDTHKRQKECTVPPLVDVNDWNTAMALRGKADMVKFIAAADSIAQFAGPNVCLYDSALWFMCFALPRHYIEAAILAAGAKE